MATRILPVEIYADIICPWCYIGKRRLEAAFAERPDVTPSYRWRAFLLNPTMPREGMDRGLILVQNLAIQQLLSMVASQLPDWIAASHSALMISDAPRTAAPPSGC